MGASEDLVEQVKQGAIAVAFLGLPATAQPHGVRAYELARDRLVAVVAPGHPLAEEPEVNLHRLSSEVPVHLHASAHRRSHHPGEPTRLAAFPGVQGFERRRATLGRSRPWLLLLAEAPGLCGLAIL
jgi:DNA-binding transcriptional LysR family regulator